MTTLGETFNSDPNRAAAYEAGYRLHGKLTAAPAPLWPEIEELDA